MFGNVPRALWEKWCPPDERGTIALGTRGFLVEDEGRRILVEAGIGCFFPPELRERFGVRESRPVLLESLSALGLGPADIDVVVLSHLHFDHAGGVLASFDGGEPRLLFERAHYVVSEGALARARRPHVRDRASFIPELPALLEGTGRLVVVPDGKTEHPILGERLALLPSEGHTPGMRLVALRGRRARALFCADLVPAVPWVHLPVTMGYDRAPERLIDEKSEFFEEWLGEMLLFEHDATVVAGRLGRDERGRYGVRERFARLLRWDLDGEPAPSEA